MFDFLKKNFNGDITNTSCVDKNNQKFNLSKDDTFFKSEILDIFIYDNMIEMDVHTKCTLREYFDCVEPFYSHINDLRIPSRVLITDGDDFFTTQLEVQKVFVLERLNFKYVIAISNKQIIVSEKKFEDQFIYETVINVDKQKKEYTIIKYIHDSNFSTQLFQWYPTRDDSKMFALDQEEALLLVYNLLHNLTLIQDIDQILNVSYLFEIIGLDSDETCCTDGSKKLSK